MKNLIRLFRKPEFPFLISRRKHVRDEWTEAGTAIFTASWIGGRGAFLPKSAPKTKTHAGRKMLEIDAVEISPLAEVWDKNGLCRVWFNNRQGECVEASKMNGWNKKPSDLRPVTSDFSDEALEKVLEIFDL